MGSDRNVCPVALLNLVLARKVQPTFAQYKYGQSVVKSKFLMKLKTQFYLKSVHMSEINSVIHTYK